MKNVLPIATFLFITISQTIAQILPVTREPYGGNKRAFVSEQIGVVKVEISYNRPGVKGRRKNLEHPRCPLRL